MGFNVRKVETSADKRRFVLLPWKIYKNSSCWIPPLVRERKRFLNPQKNPFLKESDVELFIVVSSKHETLGRIALIVNNIYNKIYSERVGFFGMFE